MAENQPVKIWPTMKSKQTPLYIPREVVLSWIYTSKDNIMTQTSSSDFAAYLSRQTGPTPIADSFGDRVTLKDDFPAANQHEVQKDHVVSWFQAKGNEAAKAVYNRLQDPAMYLWIAESVGVVTDFIERASRDAGSKYKSATLSETCQKKGHALTSYQAKIIRDQIPWVKIMDCRNTSNQR